MRTKGEIEALIIQLQSKRGIDRQRARAALVKIGKPAVPSLVNLLSSSKEHLRWEASKALGSINDSAAAAPLVDALRDESMEVRWLAGEALIMLREKSLIVLLAALEKHFDSLFLCEGAHHILHAFEREKLLNKKTIAVLDAIRFWGPKITVGVTAREALESLIKHNPALQRTTGSTAKNLRKTMKREEPK